MLVIVDECDRVIWIQRNERVLQDASQVVLGSQLGRIVEVLVERHVEESNLRAITSMISVFLETSTQDRTSRWKSRT